MPRIPQQRQFLLIAQTSGRHLAHDAGTLLFIERLGHIGLDETGATAFTVMPREATSRASDLVKPTSPALAPHS